jgi:hypothetical protein
MVDAVYNLYHFCTTARVSYQQRGAIRWSEMGAGWIELPQDAMNTIAIVFKVF